MTVIFQMFFIFAVYSGSVLWTFIYSLLINAIGINDLKKKIHQPSYAYLRGFIILSEIFLEKSVAGVLINDKRSLR